MEQAFFKAILCFLQKYKVNVYRSSQLNCCCEVRNNYEINEVSVVMKNDITLAELIVALPNIGQILNKMRGAAL